MQIEFGVCAGARFVAAFRQRQTNPLAGKGRWLCRLSDILIALHVDRAQRLVDCRVEDRTKAVSPCCTRAIARRQGNKVAASQIRIISSADASESTGEAFESRLGRQEDDGRTQNR